MLFIERTHQIFQLFRQLIGAELRRVGQPVHHIGDTTILERFSDRFPAILYKLGGIGSIHTLLNHLVKTKQRTCLQHATKNRLLSHEVRLYFGNE